MDLYKQVDKYFWKNTIGNQVQPGMFSFIEVSDYIKTSVKNRQNLGVQKFINIMKEDKQSEVSHFIDLIHEIGSHDKKEIERVIDKRLTNAFCGLFGEAILESMYEKSDKYTVLPVTNKDDYTLRVDLKIKQNKSQKILYIQVKTSSFYNNPTDYQLHKMALEKDIHKENYLTVSYAFYNHSFTERHFIIEDLMVPIYGYGNSNIGILESITDRIFKSKDGLELEKVTTDSIIF